ncbi:MAG: carboxypeptidase regulatory-like domain-containing protein, partial [Planctomycetia bacterium]|nr:carboxypeptidase regulatory-like domain-containing protein [Planctomycetia bacterium]
DGRPAVCDVRVRGAGRLPTPDVVTTTGADGRFRVDGLPAGLATVVVSDARVQSTSFAIPVPAADDVELVLGATDGVLVGQVVDEHDRRPVAGATVYASADGGSRASRLDQVVLTDAEGRFELGVAGPGTTRLEIEADGFARAPFTVDPVPVLPLVVPIAREARLEGRITRADTAAAVAGATVRVVASGNRRGPHPPIVTTSTDDEGRYALRGLAAGEVTVLAFAPGLASADAARIDARGFNPLAVTLRSGVTATIDVELASAATLSGRVRDDRGRAIDGAVVEVAIAAGMGREAGLAGSTATATGADGTFRLEAVPAGLLLRVVARAPGRATGAWGPVRAAAGDGPPIELVLPEVRRVDVEVRDARSGAAVAGARVRATAGRRSHPAEARAPVVTGADGRAAGVEIAPDGEDLEVSAAGYVPSTAVDVEPDATAVAVALRPGRTLRGRVVGPDGEPAAGATLFVRWDERSASLAGFHLADAAGEFAIDDVPPGSYHVTAEVAAGPRQAVASGRVEAGGPVATLRLAEVVASADVRTVTVRIRTPDGRVVARAAVQLDLGETRVTTWADGGVAVFGGMPTGVAGTVRVTAPTDASGVALPFAPAVAAVGPDRAEVDVTLPAGRVQRGRVVDADGRGVRGARVFAAAAEPGADDDDPGAPTDVTRTAADGTFELRALADAEHVVWVEGPPDSLASDPVRASPGAGELRFVLERGAACEVRVLDGEGRPVVGASVRVTPVVGDDAVIARVMRASRRPAVAVDATGTARIVGLEPGRVHVRRVEARAAGFLAVEDDAWTPHDEVVVLRPARRVTGLVTDLAGTPVPRAAIAWRIVGSGWTLSRAGLDGAFALEDLPDGELEVGAGRPNAMAAEGETQRVRAGATGLRFRIDAGQTLRVKVLDWPETLAGGITARLLVVGAGEPQQRARTVDVDGTVEFRGVTAGRRSLHVEALPDGRTAYVEDLGGDAEVSVRLVPGRTTTGVVTLPAGARSPEVYAEGPPGAAARAEVGADGRFVLRGLVEGTWTVHARARVGDAIWSAVATVRAGDEAKLTLAPR